MAAAAGAALGAVGTIGQTASDVMTSDVNAKGLDAQARSIDQQTTFDVTQQRRLNRLMLGNAVATTAASGVAITSGSPLLHELDRVKQATIEEESIQRAGNMGAAAKRFDSRLTRRQIPFQILGGVAKLGGQGAGYASTARGGNAGSGSVSTGSTPARRANSWFGP